MIFPGYQVFYFVDDVVLQLNWKVVNTWLLVSCSGLLAGNEKRPSVLLNVKIQYCITILHAAVLEKKLPWFKIDLFLHLFDPSEASTIRLKIVQYLWIYCGTWDYIAIYAVFGAILDSEYCIMELWDIAARCAVWQLLLAYEWRAGIPLMRLNYRAAIEPYAIYNKYTMQSRSRLRIKNYTHWFDLALLLTLDVSGG